MLTWKKKNVYVVHKITTNITRLTRLANRKTNPLTSLYTFVAVWDFQQENKCDVIDPTCCMKLHCLRTRQKPSNEIYLTVRMV